MASTRKLEPSIRLSPREAKLLAALRERGWTDTTALSAVVFGFSEKEWPLNARKMIAGALRGLQQKLTFHQSRTKIAKSGDGGRGGYLYRLE